MAEATGAPDRTSPARRGSRLDLPAGAPAHGARPAPAAIVRGRPARAIAHLLRSVRDGR